MSPSSTWCDHQQGIHRPGPVRPEMTRQASFVLGHFHLDWQARQATCPQEKESKIECAADVCLAGPVHADCPDATRKTASARGP